MSDIDEGNSMDCFKEESKTKSKDRFVLKLSDEPEELLNQVKEEGRNMGIKIRITDATETMPSCLALIDLFMVILKCNRIRAREKFESLKTAETVIYDPKAKDLKVSGDSNIIIGWKFPGQTGDSLTPIATATQCIRILLAMKEGKKGKYPRLVAFKAACSDNIMRIIAGDPKLANHINARDEAFKAGGLNDPISQACRSEMLHENGGQAPSSLNNSNNLTAAQLEAMHQKQLMIYAEREHIARLRALEAEARKAEAEALKVEAGVPAAIMDGLESSLRSATAVKAVTARDIIMQQNTETNYRAIMFNNSVKLMNQSAVSCTVVSASGSSQAHAQAAEAVPSSEAPQDGSAEEAAQPVPVPMEPIVVPKHEVETSYDKVGKELGYPSGWPAANASMIGRYAAAEYRRIHNKEPDQVDRYIGNKLCPVKIYYEKDKDILIFAIRKRALETEVKLPDSEVEPIKEVADRIAEEKAAEKIAKDAEKAKKDAQKAKEKEDKKAAKDAEKAAKDAQRAKEKEDKKAAKEAQKAKEKEDKKKAKKAAEVSKEDEETEAAEEVKVAEETEATESVESSEEEKKEKPCTKSSSSSSKASSKKKPKTEVDPEPEVEEKPKTKTKAKAAPKPEVEEKPKTKAKAKAAPKVEPEPEPEAEEKPKRKTKVKTAPKVEPEPEPEPKADEKPKRKTKVKTAPKVEPEPEPKLKPKAKAKAKPKSETEELSSLEDDLSEAEQARRRKAPASDSE